MVKTLFIGYIIYHDDTMRTSIISTCQCTKSFLTRSIPYGYFNFFISYFHFFNFEINSYCALLFFLEFSSFFPIRCNNRGNNNETTFSKADPSLEVVASRCETRLREVNSVCNSAKSFTVVVVVVALPKPSPLPSSQGDDDGGALDI